MTLKWDKGQQRGCNNSIWIHFAYPRLTVANFSDSGLLLPVNLNDTDK